MPGLADVSLVWPTLFACLGLLASAWRIHETTLAVIGLASLAYFFVWNHLFIADDPSPISAVERASETISLDLRDHLLQAAVAIEANAIAWPLIATGVFAILGTSLYSMARHSTNAPQRSDHGIARRSLLVNAAVVLGKLVIGAGVAGLIMIIVGRTGHDIDLARVAVAALGESRLALTLVATAASIGLGMFMPGPAAFLIAITLFGPALRSVGFDGQTTLFYLLAICMSTWLIKKFPIGRTLTFHRRASA